MDPISALQCLRDNAADLGGQCGDHLKEWDAIGCQDKMLANACWTEINQGVTACATDTATFCAQDAHDPREWHDCIADHEDKLSDNCKAAGETVHQCMKSHCHGPDHESHGYCDATMMFYGEGPDDFGRPHWGRMVGGFVLFVAAISCCSTMMVLLLAWVIKRYGCCKCCARSHDMSRSVDDRQDGYNPLLQADGRFQGSGLVGDV